MTIYHTVYQITNKINNKIYVGVHMTENLDDGYPGSGHALETARKKYGDENFIKEILSLHNTYPEALVEEARIVDKAFVNRRDNYNLKTGGGGPGAGFPSEESRAKMSAAHKGKTLSAETKAKMSAAHKGKTPSEETRVKLSAAQKGNTKMLGKTHSAETKIKMSAAQKGNTKMLGKTRSAETKAKMSAAQKGKPKSAETKAKMSARAKARVKKECPYCKVKTDPSPYAQWHGNNCRQKLLDI